MEENDDLRVDNQAQEEVKEEEQLPPRSEIQEELALPMIAQAVLIAQEPEPARARRESGESSRYEEPEQAQKPEKKRLPIIKRSSIVPAAGTPRSRLNQVRHSH